MARSSLLPYAFVCAPYICMGKVLRISNDFSSEASGLMMLKFHVEPPWGREMKECLNGRGPLTKVASRTEDALGLNLCTNHWGWEVCQNC